jgi:hypothetical protein
MQPPNAAIFKDSPERYDLYRDLVQIIQTAESFIKSTRLRLPNTPECWTLVNNLDRELYELFLFPEQHSIVGRRCFIQEVWRFAAMICISAVSHLHQADLPGAIDKFLQRLHVLDTTVEWDNMVGVLVHSILEGQTVETPEITKQLNSLS